MKQIDDYVDSVFRKYKKTQSVLDLKEEIRTHLLESVRELIDSGKTEEESLSLAVERFGGSRYFNGELEKLLGARKIAINWVLSIALILLAMGLLSGVVFKRMENHYGQTQSAFTQQVFSLFPQGNFRMSSNLIKAIDTIAQQDGIQMKSIKVFYSPGASTNGKPLTTHVYSGNVYPNIHYSLGFATTNPNPNAKQWTMDLQYRFMPHFNPILVLVPFSLSAGYWTLFAIWASIHAHHRRRLNWAWIIAFSCLNVLAWILFRSFKPSGRLQTI